MVYSQFVPCEMEGNSVVAISAEVDGEGHVTVINVSGRFDFSLHEEFCAAYEGSRPGTPVYRVDMREATSLDSSALGMLLLLRDYAGGDQARVEIVNCSAEVRNLLSVCSFESLFTIH